jgi:hypothetical protein
MDLVRTILLGIESSPPGGTRLDFGLSYSPQEIGYHLYIMKQEGLIEGHDVTSGESRGPEIIPRGIAWKGHEFLDLARDQERWNQAKAIIARVGSAPIAVWTKVLSDLLLKSVEKVVPQAS